MQLHLDEIASQVAAGAHAILVLDRAGWHTAKALLVPKNITLMSLPPRSPELNPTENISGSTCARTGSPTASSKPMTTSWLYPPMPGTSSPIGHGPSCPSQREIGQQSVTINEDWYKLQRCGYGARERRQRAFSMRPFGPNCRRYAASYSWAPLSLVQRAEMMSQLQESLGSGRGWAAAHGSHCEPKSHWLSAR